VLNEGITLGFFRNVAAADGESAEFDWSIENNFKNISYETYSYQKNGYLWKLYEYFLQMVYNNHQIPYVQHAAIMLPMRRDKLWKNTDW
jgi:hypothetical protein